APRPKWGGLMARVHQRRDREPVVGDARLLALVEVPALLAREAQARQRDLGRVLELHVDHDDGRREDALLGILDRAREDLLADRDVVDPDLPELPRPVVDVAVRDAPGLLVDEEDRSEEHTSELQSRFDVVCRLLLEKKKKNK